MSKFHGYWEMDESFGKAENYVNFCKATGMSQEETEGYGEMKENITYSGKDDNWVSEISTGGEKSRHEFKLGVKSQPQKGPEGSTFCIQATLESDDKLVEMSWTQLPGHDKEVVTKTDKILTSPNKMKIIVTDVASNVPMTYFATRK